MAQNIVQDGNMDFNPRKLVCGKRGLHRQVLNQYGITIQAVANLCIVGSRRQLFTNESVGYSTRETGSANVDAEHAQANGLAKTCLRGGFAELEGLTIYILLVFASDTEHTWEKYTADFGTLRWWFFETFDAPLTNFPNASCKEKQSTRTNKSRTGKCQLPAVST
jgi:hypothetical protein